MDEPLKAAAPPTHATMLDLIVHLTSDFKRITGIFLLLICSFPFVAIGLNYAERWGFIGTSPEVRILERIATAVSAANQQHAEQNVAAQTSNLYLDRNLAVIKRNADKTIDRLDVLCVVNAMQTATPEDDQICAGIIDYRDKNRRTRDTAQPTPAPHPQRRSTP